MSHSITPEMPTGAASAARGLSGAWAAVVILAAGAIVFAAGLTGPVVVADEAYHYGFAEAWTKAGFLHRPAHNPIYGEDAHGWYYASEPLWPMAVSLLWHVTGIGQWSAQLYQAAMYMLLLAAVYGLGRRRLGPQGAMAALLVAVSIPMFTAFSVMLYVDVPGTALAAVALLLILDKRFLWAGVVMGLAYLTKRTTLFLVPPFLLWALLEQGTFWQRLRRAAALLVPMAGVVMPESIWTRWHIPMERQPLTLNYFWEQLLTVFSKNQMPSSLLNPRDLLQYFGAVLAVLVPLYVVRRRWAAGDGRLWMTLGLFMVPIILFFAIDTDVRYVMPAAPLLILAATRGLAPWWNKRWVLGTLAAAAFVHLGAVAWWVSANRHLTAGQEAVVQYLGTQTPQGTMVLYPGEALMAESRRPVLWANLKDPATGLRRRASLVALFAERNPAKVRAFLAANDIKYVIIDTTRPNLVYDDRREARPGGYPLTFVERLPTFEFLEKVPGLWPGMEVWKVR